ncbi:type II toxin-antitoxin system RelE/ParE family toxin [Aquimarina rubra]|uniref:Type II toxin-antitoxin system RelE/ParE family toxin n=1 Tax=Aquimarina rubra TaxID=1920033 RepID=A0ABW5LG49_9FLAO
MARRIIWTSKADLVFTEILEFYYNRNKSKTYSRKLNQEINSIIKLLPKYPLLGIKTDVKDIRVIIKGDYKIFYQIESSEIIIH